jgi:hypothetical protein
VDIITFKHPKEAATMKYFHTRLFSLFLVVFATITYFSFSAAFALDEDALSKNALKNFFANVYNIMRFPTHSLFGYFTKTPLRFALGLIINCLLYSLLLERTIYFIFYREKETDTDTTEA